MVTQAVRFAIATSVPASRATFMSELTIYHNPACSKSRETLALLRSRGHEPRIVEYLKTPPTEAEFSAIVRKLGIEPLQLVRRNEQVFKDKYAGKTLDDKQWIKAMVANPILIERPIVVRGAAAAIGRPPQNVEALLRRHDP
jgi:arsenate reductase (glutaredoxin)